jgi:hypothetical protein
MSGKKPYQSLSRFILGITGVLLKSEKRKNKVNCSLTLPDIFGFVKGV